MDNVGTLDKLIRLSLALIIFILFFNGTIVGAAAVALVTVATALTLTSFASFCPIYSALGWDSGHDNPMHL
jgi:hypothetical protein